MAIISIMAQNFASGDGAELAKRNAPGNAKSNGGIGQAAPPGPCRPEAEPPPEWFMYPPF